MSTVAERIVALAREDAGTIAFSPEALDALALFLVDELAAQRGEDAVGGLLEVAMFLDVQKHAPEAAAQLVRMAQRLALLLARQGAPTADALAARADEQARTLRAFEDKPESARPLESGARPAGTTAASPLARFLLRGDEKK